LMRSTGPCLDRMSAAGRSTHRATDTALEVTRACVTLLVTTASKYYLHQHQREGVHELRIDLRCLVVWLLQAHDEGIIHSLAPHQLQTLIPLLRQLAVSDAGPASDSFGEGAELLYTHLFKGRQNEEVSVPAAGAPFRLSKGQRRRQENEEHGEHRPHFWPPLEDAADRAEAALGGRKYGL
jgi:hypothetical protein